MSETYRLSWDRELHGEHARTERIRYRRKRGEWVEVDSIDELPGDVRAAYERSREHDQRSGATRHRVRPVVPHRQPRTREVDRTLYIDHPWFNGCTVVMFLIAVPVMAYQSWSELGAGGVNGTAAVIMLGVSILLGYYGLCLIVNSTEFRVDSEYLTVKHGPLPWFGHRKIPACEIVQLSTHYHYSKHSSHYRVRAHLRNGRSVQILEYAETEAEARSIERAIERHLGIEDWDA